MWTQAEWERMLARQEEQEAMGLSMGVDRFRKRLQSAQEKGRGSMVGGARKLLQEAIAPVTKAIQWKIEEAQGARGRKHTALKLIRPEEDYPEDGKPNLSTKKVGADVAAFLGTRVVLDEVIKGPQDAKNIALDVTRYILDELRYRRLKEEAPALFKYRMGKFATSSYAHRSRSLAAAVRYAEVDTRGLDLPVSARLLIGLWVLDAIIEATGLVEKETETTRTPEGKPEKRLLLRPAVETLEWLEARNGLLETLSPVNMPMLAPPLPWRKGDLGGRRFAQRGRAPLIRGFSQKTVKAEHMDLPLVFAALNRVQETGWKINRDVLEILEAIERKGGGIAGVPPMDNEELPTIEETLHTLRQEDPEGWRGIAIEDGNPVGGTEEQRHALVREHRYALGRVRDRNYQRRLARLTYLRVVSTARSVADEPVFWFPWNLDFRGRMYPLVDYLSPQGSDLEKALLTFADGKPMGPHGRKWLAIHLMNSLDETPEGQKVGRMTLEERVRWVEANEDRIVRVAEDPFGDLWWADADCPLQFYAACCEWARFRASGYSECYVSSLPCAMDGSCNGLQHYAAMFRDEIGARAVNVRANDRPRDVYADVAEAVLDRLEQLHAEEGDEWALLWISSGLVDRKLCKRPVMTFGYGSKPYGFSQQILEDLLSRPNVEEIAEHFAQVDPETGEVKDRLPEACQYIAQRIWEALGGVVVKAFEGMEKFQEWARAVARTGKPVTWRVPVTGFPVVQNYYEGKMKRIDTILAGSVVRPCYWEFTDKPAAHKQANAVAPNLIHSLDAAALMLTVNAAADQGVVSFGMVHDSYATVPGDCELLARTLREEFVRLYDRDIPADIRQQFQEQAGEELSEAPAMGSLDLGEVLVSPYFFC